MNKMQTFIVAALISLWGDTALFADQIMPQTQSAKISETAESANAVFLQQPPAPLFPYLIPISEIHDPDEEESPFRRAEIIFFVSYPFILFMHIGIYTLFSYINDSRSDLSVNRISSDTTGWMLISSAVASATITWADYERRRRLSETQSEHSLKEARLNLQMSRRF